MGTGTITWACLLLAVHQGPADEIPFNAREMKIPIRIHPQKVGNVRELTLLVSHDRGKTWDVGSPPLPPTAKEFQYRAKEDGPYWFIVQERDNAGNYNPPDPMRARPSQRLMIDTVKPQVQVTAEPLPGGQVRVRWSIHEPAPVERSLRLEYHTDAMQPDRWTPFPLQSSLQGDQAFPISGNAREVRVRVRIQDQAGNLGENEARVSLAGATGAAGAAAANTPGAGEGPGPFSVIPTARAENAAPPAQLTSNRVAPPLIEPAPQGLPAPSSTPAPIPTPDELHPPARPPALGTSDHSTLPAATATNTETPNGALPPLKIVNKRDVRLDFKVNKVGPSGLGNADVYVTLNEGASWSKLPNEVPLLLQTGADRPGAGPVHGAVSVQLPNEKVIYGFKVAVKSKAGRAQPPPRNGEPPQVRVELDATVPQAQLYGPMPEGNQSNALVLSWSATDRNLAADGIKLEWAERKEGPWSVIADKLPNKPANSSAGGALPPQATGSYVWQLPERMPSSVYLKLTVRDNAANVAIAQADKPVLIDLSVPETEGVSVSSPASGGR